MLFCEQQMCDETNEPDFLNIFVFVTKKKQ